MKRVRSYVLMGEFEKNRVAEDITEPERYGHIY